MLKFFLTLVLFLASLMPCFGQRQLALNGYVKQMQTLLPLPDTMANSLGRRLLVGNLIHHRLNSSYYFNNKLTFKADLRNRLMYGDLAQMMGSTADLGNDVFKLSDFLVAENDVYWHIIFDRMYLEYITGDWEIRAGRQRINWGINTIYNPNDIFNAANFFDFDYEERPGSDAVRITKYTGISSSIEVAFKYFNPIQTFDTLLYESVSQNCTGAMLYKTTRWNYDMQFLAGIDQEYTVIGAGWSGYIKGKYGFKGELSYFDNWYDETVSSQLIYSIATDFTLGKDWIFMGGVLYNQQNETSNALNIGQAFTQLNSSVNMNARNLSNTKWNIMALINKPINGQVAWSSALIAMPSATANTTLWMNTLSYSIKDNWDLDFVNQLIIVYQDGLLPINMANFRLKYSY